MGTPLAAACQFSPNLVILDVSLTPPTGLEATKAIVNNHLQTKVLTLSADEGLALARVTLEIGAAGHILKRSACDELVRALRVVASGGTYLDPALGGLQLSSNACKDSAVRRAAL